MTVDYLSVLDGMNAHEPFGELDSLLSTLQAGVSAFKSELSMHGLPPPSSTRAHPLDAGNWPSHKIYEARRTILATLGVLQNVFVTPFEKLTETTHRAGETASLHLIARLGIADLLPSISSSASVGGDGDEETSRGIHINKLAAAADVPVSKLSGPLRLLTTSGWFEEVEEDVFRGTKMSEQLRKGNDAQCWARATEFSARSVSGLAEAVTRQDWRHSFSSLHAGCQIGHRSEKHMFELIRSNPEQLFNFTHGVQALESSVLLPIVRDFPWNTLPSGTTLVDVGGGNGGLCIALAKQYPTSDLKFLVQDLPDTIQSAKQHMEEAFSFPSAPSSGTGFVESDSVDSVSFSTDHASDTASSHSVDTVETTPSMDLTGVARVSAEAHDFFSEQPREGDGYSFCLKWVLHNWPDAGCVNILSKLAKAAGPQSRIFVIDNLVTPCTLRSTAESDIAESLDSLKGAKTYEPITAPPYVPMNFGQAGKFPLQLSVFMTAGLNASERTLKEFLSIYDRAGLRLVKVHSLRSWVSIMELAKK